MDSKPFLTPSPLPSPAATIPNPLSPSSSKRVTISEPNSNPSSDSFTFNPQTRTTSRSRSNRTQPVRVASARSDSTRGSQREIPDEEARFIYINQPNPSPNPPSFKPNKIRTSKYTLLTFLPRNLFEQFHRVAYIYFLILIALNQIPQLGVFTPAASILPLAFVLTVTAAKDGFEDWRRHRSDLTENNRSSFVLSGTDFHPVPWKSIRVGDIIRVGSNETLPSDMVILSTSDASGVAYVQTINLDGESNLKSRYAKQETQNILPDRLQCVIRCEQPNRNIYGFNGRIDLGTKRVPIGPGNVILRGCEIKNTEWVIGVVVYTGMETKVMLNSTGAPTKKSRLETNMNRETIYLAVALFILCSVVTILGGLWLDRHEKELDYLPYYRKMDYEDKKGGKYKYYGIGWEVVFTFLMGVIQFQVMIPIALFISMEIVRVGQAYFMIQDEGMYHEESDSRFQCRALNINEDLGQIKYVFSDKTGTLTDNKMEFRCASVGGVDYGSGMEGGDGASVTVDGQTWRPKTKVEPDPELLHLLSQNNSKEANRAKDFILALAACNTIVPIVVDTPDPSLKLIDYQGESPDEQALVYAAAAYGFLLVERTSGHIVIDVLGQRERYDVLGLHEFDSDRKRMSVIVGCPDKTVKLFVKGADNSMFGIIDSSLDLDLIKTTEAHLHKYSSLGLRTLVIGMRELTSSEFSTWQSSYEKASTALFGRGSLLKAVASSVECNLQLLGASGIEDKLQQGVPEAIESLRQAGIKVWVLTGDKQETAMSIGYSCKLLSNEMTQIIINSRNKESCKKSLDDALTMTQKIAAISPSGNETTRIPLALIIDGTSLVYILESELEETLFKVATTCDVVLCCRVAPLQKAGIVALIKNRTDDMTLAIGDGANDVSMIQMADVGIGISGQEGRQAVMASDFAMGQFRFLVPLLLVHGHWNYQRMAYMILYNFYRNAVFVLMLFWYVLYTAFSLTTAITEWSSVLYSVIYTALPTIIVGILDKDLSRKTLLKYPQLYGSGHREERYNLKLFILTMLDTIWQSAAIFFIPYLAYVHSEIDSSSIGDLWTIAVVIIVNIHLSIDVFRWNWMTHASIWGCTVATLICVIVIDALPMLPGYWAIFNVMGTGVFWLCLVGIIVTAMIPRVVTKVITEYFMPSDIQVARELEKFGSLYEAAATEVPMTTFSNFQHQAR